MMTTRNREPRTLGAAIGAGRPNRRWGCHRQAGTRRSWRLGRRSPYPSALVVLTAITLGMTWALGLVGCSAVPNSSYTDATSGASFPNVRQSPGEVTRLLRNAHYYKLMGRPELALKELELAHRQNPDNLQLVNTLAQNYEELGQFETARKLYKEALDRNGPHPALANNLCFTYYLEGRYQEAETCFRQTLARDANNEAARNNLGLLYCRLGRQDEARRLWQEVENSAAADYKTRQALAALGMADRAVYAQRNAPTRDEVAAAPKSPASAPAATLAPQKVAMRVPTAPPPEQPVPDNDQPDNMILEQPGPSQEFPVSAVPATPDMPKRTVSARTPQPESAKPKTPTPVAAVSPSTASAPVKPHLPAAPPAPQKVAMRVAPEKPAMDLVRTGIEAQPKPSPGPAAPVQAPSATPRSRQAPLTCAELMDTAIEVRNGTPAPHLAREVRVLLRQEAFTVVKIGNHVDFGAGKTIIYYRSEAQRVAQALQTEIFPMASLEHSDGLPGKVAIKVLLGRDILENQDMMARLDEEEAQPAAAAQTPPSSDNRQAAPAPAKQEPQGQPQEKSVPPQAPVPVAQTPGPHASEPVTAAEREYTAIEVLNGTRTHNLARRTRSLLDQEGFSVARIGNYKNFGADKTIIYYRPETQKVARALGETLFPGAGLEPSSKLRKDIAVQILLGADFLERPQVMARLANEAR